VIDHTPEILLLIQELLLSESYRVTAMDQCPESADWLAELQPDVIIHDYTPVTTELDLASMQQMIAHPRTRYTPIVLCSAAPTIDEVAATLASPTVRVVRKPFALDDLLTTVATSLGAAPRIDHLTEMSSSAD
jgi:CheY-like chemotaxis protein